MRKTGRANRVAVLSRDKTDVSRGGEVNDRGKRIKYDRITPLLRELHWLRLPERNKFRLAVLVFRCRNNTAPAYLAKDLQWATDDDSRRRLRSASSHKLIVRRSRRTIGDRAFSVAAPRLWNALPPDVVSAPSLPVFKKLLKTHLFNQSLT